MSTWQPTSKLRWYRESGFNGATVLQQRWVQLNGTHEEQWREVELVEQPEPEPPPPPTHDYIRTDDDLLHTKLIGAPTTLCGERASGVQFDSHPYEVSQCRLCMLAGES